MTVNFLSKSALGALVGAVCSIVLLTADWGVSYFFSIALQLNGFGFLIARFLILLALAGTLAMLIRWLMPSNRSWLFVTCCLLAYYYVFVIIRIYEANVLDMYTFFTDPLSASFLPILIGLIGGTKFKRKALNGQ